MKRIAWMVMMAALVCLPGTALTQDDEDQFGYAFVTYFECDAGREYRADEIIELNYKPHYDAAIEAGDIVQWGWFTHFIGGKWRRALVLGAANMDDLLAASGALGEAIEANTPQAGRDFTEICPIHEDYIWRTNPGTGGVSLGTPRGDVGFSIYYDCNENQEERADALMRDTFKPVYDSKIGDDGLITWNWLSHIVGDKWRRVLSMTGRDHNSIMRIRNEIIEELSSGRTSRAYNQFREICTDHTDYMWDIAFESP